MLELVRDFQVDKFTNNTSNQRSLKDRLEFSGTWLKYANHSGHNRLKCLSRGKLDFFSCSLKMFELIRNTSSFLIMVRSNMLINCNQTNHPNRLIEVSHQAVRIYEWKALISNRLEVWVVVALLSKHVLDDAVWDAFFRCPKVRIAEKPLWETS